MGPRAVMELLGVLVVASPGEKEKDKMGVSAGRNSLRENEFW